MSTSVYAGHLCATHVGENIKHPDLPEAYDWRLRHVGHRYDRPTVRIVCVAYPHLAQHGTVVLDVDPRDIVTVTA